jgi:uncharacterized protein (UPF0303 family)
VDRWLRRRAVRRLRHSSHHFSLSMTR